LERHERRVGRTVLAAGMLAAGSILVRRSLLRVRGPSMRPTFAAGDLVLTVPLPPAGGRVPLVGLAWQLRQRLVRPGAIVVVRHPSDAGHLLIKRASAVSPDGIDVVGDDPGWSIDSRTFGTVPHRDVRRLVVARVPDRWWPRRST
jgi:signal peptidase I